MPCVLYTGEHRFKTAGGSHGPTLRHENIALRSALDVQWALAWHPRGISSNRIAWF